jgi:hypothetical protein
VTIQNRWMQTYTVQTVKIRLLVQFEVLTAVIHICTSNSLLSFPVAIILKTALQDIFVHYSLSITLPPRYNQLKARSVANELPDNTPSGSVITTSTESCGG